MKKDEKDKNSVTPTAQERAFRMDLPEPQGALLIAHAHGAVSGCVDRIAVEGSLTVGRRPDSGLCIDDAWLSGFHFEISFVNREAFIQDLGSTNGTYLDGAPLAGKQRIAGGSVIRAGRSVLVFQEAGAPFLEPLASECFGMVGPFHVTPLVRRLGRPMCRPCSRACSPALSRRWVATSARSRPT